ncbi:MAG TPA: AI-2E family transporter [Anaerolineales bacterium]|nr:AI-2E family transporter [Anaerolineales bacterium]
MTNEWKTGTRYLVGAGLVLVVVWLLYLSRPVLPELVVAILLAFLVRPTINYFHLRLRMPKASAVAVTYFIAGLVLLIVPLVFLPHLVNAVGFLIGIDYQVVVDTVVRWLVDTLTAWKLSGLRFFGIVISVEAIVDPVLDALKNPGTALPGSLSSITSILSSLFSLLSRSAASVVGSVASSLLSLVFVLVASVYLSVDGPKMIRSVLDGLPESQRPEITELFHRLERLWDAFLRGQLLLMVIIGTAVALGTAALGLPNALSLGLLAGFLELVPNLGPLLAVIPAALIALLQGSTYLAIPNGWFALIVVAFYVTVQSLENTVIVPRVLGDAVKVHPLIILAGVLVGAATAGVLGVFLAAPIIASLREVLGYLYRKVLNVDPFPASLDALPAEPGKARVSFAQWIGNLRRRLPFARRSEPPAEVAVLEPAVVEAPTLEADVARRRPGRTARTVKTKRRGRKRE